MLHMLWKKFIRISTVLAQMTGGTNAVFFICTRFYAILTMSHALCPTLLLEVSSS